MYDAIWYSCTCIIPRAHGLIPKHAKPKLEYPIKFWHLFGWMQKIAHLTKCYSNFEKVLIKKIWYAYILASNQGGIIQIIVHLTSTSSLITCLIFKVCINIVKFKLFLNMINKANHNKKCQGVRYAIRQCCTLARTHIAYYLRPKKAIHLMICPKKTSHCNVHTLAKIR